MSRARTPTAIKVLTGNPGKRPFNLAEPKPTGTVGQPSAMLDKAAKDYYHQLAQVLSDIGLLTSVDQTILEMHCQAWADVQRLTKQVRTEGEVITGVNKKGEPYSYRNPKTTIINERIKVVRDTCRDMGLTPEARSKLSVSAQQAKPGDSLLDFISKAG